MDKIFKSDEYQIYLFVYGSLMNKESRKRTLKYETEELDVTLLGKAGYSCEWCFRSEKFKMTALGLCKKKASKDIIGKIIKIKIGDFVNLDKREVGYERIVLSSKLFKYENKSFNIKKVYTYIVKDPKGPTDEYPIKEYYRQLCNK